MVNDKLVIHFDVKLQMEKLKAELKILWSFVNNPELLLGTEVKVNDILVPLNVGGEKIEDLKSQLIFEEKNFAQIEGKVLATETDCLLRDYNFVDCERTLNFLWRA